jgi:hypothetical protein
MLATFSASIQLDKPSAAFALVGNLHFLPFLPLDLLLALAAVRRLCRILKRKSLVGEFGRYGRVRHDGDKAN